MNGKPPILKLYFVVSNGATKESNICSIVPPEYVLLCILHFNLSSVIRSLGVRLLKFHILFPERFRNPCLPMTEDNFIGVSSVSQKVYGFLITQLVLCEVWVFVVFQIVARMFRIAKIEFIEDSFCTLSHWTSPAHLLF